MGYAMVLLLGICLVLTVENTIMIHRKPKAEKPRELTADERAKEAQKKRDEEDWEKVQNYHGRVK